MIIVTLTDCEGPAPPPEAVAVFVTETAARSTSEIVLVAVQVTIAFRARLVFASPQLSGVAPMRLLLTVNWAGPRATLPVFLMTYVKVITCPTRL